MTDRPLKYIASKVFEGVQFDDKKLEKHLIRMTEMAVEEGYLKGIEWGRKYPYDDVEDDDDEEE